MDHSIIDTLIGQLETRTDMTVADFDPIVQSLHYLMPDVVSADHNLASRISMTDGAMHIADDAFPNWAVHVHGRANDRDGHWRCTLRESDNRDSDAMIGSGRSPVLSQAILAAVMRLALLRKT